MLSVHIRGEGEIDCRRERFDDNLFLIRTNGTIVGRRAGGSRPLMGDNFFDFYEIEKPLRPKLCANGLLDDFSPILIVGEKLPILFFRSLMPAAELLLAVIPRGELADALSSAEEVTRLMPELRILKRPAAPRNPLPDFLLGRLEEWLAPLRYLFTFESLQPHPAVNELLLSLSNRATALARFCGCHLIYNFNGIGFSPIEKPDWDGMTATMLAIFIATRRLSSTHTVSLHMDRENDYAPMIHALMHVHDVTDPVPELQHFNRAAAIRASYFSASAIPTDSKLFHIRFSTTRLPITDQGVRTHCEFRDP